ncbi:MAG: hypothetical protein DI534_05220 [Leifsonia xyli]|nr:MAG: hypothetical protein DI534_05220 [Leifsonia xyli]
MQRLINLLRHPVFGPTVGAWLYGLSDKEMTYGPDAALVQGLQTTTHIEETRSRVREYLRDGSFTAEGLDAYYDAGGFTLEDGSFNRKVVTDGLALSFPELASNRAAATASLGSYHMQVFASDINPTTRTATVAFVGWNEMTLGSAMASAGGLREVANQYAPASGPLSAVRMDFGWTETIHY